jgi:hypothetical protein
MIIEAVTGPEGVEIRVYDPARRPHNWSAIILPTQFVVFLQDVRSSMPLSRDGTPSGPGQATCTLFDSLDDAQRFCEETVRLRPNVCCEVFDSDGRAKPPLLTVAHQNDDVNGWWARHSRYIALLLMAGSLPLFWIDWTHRGLLILPTLLAINMIVAALRILHWRGGVLNAEEDRRRRMAAHGGGSPGIEQRSSSTNQSPL